MKEAFKRILSKLEGIEVHCLEMSDWQGQSAIESAIEIIKQEQQSYIGNWIPCSERLPDKEGSYLSVMDKDYSLIRRFINESKKQTNADRIRSMTDEELAIHMMCPNEMGLAEIECDKSDSCNCYECLLKWLRAESEE